MSWNLIHLKDMQASKWRNGGGETRELLAWPLGASGVAADWDWRLSVADVTANGPFSRFDGVDRWFAVLQGDGVRLRMDGMALEVTPYTPPFQFDGGAGVHCDLLGGATQDFNLMARRGRGQAAMQRVTKPFKRTGMPVGALLAVYCGESTAQLQLGGESSVDVPAHCLAWRLLVATASVQVLSDGALWLEIRP